MAHILSYGSLNLDLVYQVPHFVQAGETLSSTSPSPPHGPGERSATPERSAETAPS